MHFNKHQKLHIMKKEVSHIALSFAFAFCLLSSSIFGQTNWQVINTSTNSQLLHNLINKIYQDKLGDIWVGTGKGLNIIRNDYWTEYTKANGLPHKAVMDICEDKNGHMWVATLKGIAKFDGKDWWNINTTNGLINNAVYALEADTDGNVWVGTKKGVSFYNGEHWKSFTTDNGLIHNFVLDIMEDSEGKIWFATKKGISVYNGSGWMSYTKESGLARPFVWSMDETSEGVFWIGTHTGAFNTFNGVHWQLVKKGSGYYRAGNLGIGLLLGLSMTLLIGPVVGVAFFAAYAIAGAFPSPSLATRVYIDNSDNVWLAAQPKGVFMFDGKDWIRYSSKNGLPHNRVNTFFEMNNEDMWLGTNGGIAILKK